MSSNFRRAATQPTSSISPFPAKSLRREQRGRIVSSLKVRMPISGAGDERVAILVPVSSFFGGDTTPFPTHFSSPFGSTTQLASISNPFATLFFLIDDRERWGTVYRHRASQNPGPEMRNTKNDEILSCNYDVRLDPRRGRHAIKTSNWCGTRCCGREPASGLPL